MVGVELLEGTRRPQHCEGASPVIALLALIDHAVSPVRTTAVS